TARRRPRTERNSLATSRLDHHRLAEELAPPHEESPADLEPDRDAGERHLTRGEQVTRRAERDEILEEDPDEHQAAEAHQPVAERPQRLADLDQGMGSYQPHPQVASAQENGERARGQDHAALKASTGSEVAVHHDV